MLERDPEFYRRWAAIMAQVPEKAMALSCRLNGNKFDFFVKNKYIASINTGLFYRLKPPEVVKYLGMDVDKKRADAYGTAQGPS